MNSLAGQPGVKSPDTPGLTESDRMVSETMMKMWAQFAKTGDPNVDGVIEWPVYDKDADQYMYFADPLEIRSGFSKLVPESPPPAASRTQ
jgi:para-nitrobenzyl esterase